MTTNTQVDTHVNVMPLAKESLYNGENYPMWRKEVDLMLLELGFVMKENNVSFTATDLADAGQRTITGKRLLMRSVMESKKILLETANTLFEMLEKIKADFISNSASVRARQRTIIYNIRFEGPGKMKEMFDRLDAEAAKLRVAEGVIEDEELAVVAGNAVNRVTREFNYITDAGLKYAELKDRLIVKDSISSTYDPVQSNLALDHERVKAENEELRSALNVNRGFGQGHKRGGYGGGRGNFNNRRISTNWGGRVGNNFVDGGGYRGYHSNKTCYSCGMPGHIARSCPQPKAYQLSQAGRSDSTANSVISSVSANNAINKYPFNFYLSAFTTLSALSHVVLDSGAEEHFVGEQMQLNNSRQICDEQVRVANGDLCPVINAGNYTLKGATGDIVVTEAKQVKGMTNNLLSVSKLVDQGFEVTFKKENAVITRNGYVCTVFNRKGGLFVGETVRTSEAYMSRGSTDHASLGHPGKTATKRLQNIYPDLKVENKESICEPCILGKLKRKDHYPSSTKTTSPLQLVHIDISGPHQLSYDNKKYFMVLVDDWTKFVKAYPLKSRAGEEVTAVLQDYVYQMESTTKHKVKSIRTDNAAEFTGGPFQSELMKRQIAHQRSSPHDHEQNGAAERMIQTLLVAVRVNLIQGNVPEKYWSEAVITSAHQRNVASITPGKELTPYYGMFGKQYDKKRDKPFGTLSFVWLDPVQRKYNSKIRPTGVRCFLGGLARNMKAYRFIDPRTDKLYITDNANICLDHWYWNDERFELNKDQLNVLNNIIRNSKQNKSFDDHSDDDDEQPNMLVDISSRSDDDDDDDDDSSGDNSTSGSDEPSTPVRPIPPANPQTPRRTNRIRRPPTRLIMDPSQRRYSESTEVRGLFPEEEQEWETDPEQWRGDDSTLDHTLEPTNTADDVLQPTENPRNDSADPQPSTSRLLPLVELTPSTDPFLKIRTTTFGDGTTLTGTLASRIDQLHEMRDIQLEQNKVASMPWLGKAYRKSLKKSFQIAEQNMIQQEKDLAESESQQNERQANLVKSKERNPKIPMNHQEAMNSPWCEYWKDAENEELQSLQQNGTFDVVNESRDVKPISTKWVYSIKRNGDGTIDRFKARCVARGFEQRPGIDFGSTFAATAGATTIRTFLTVCKVKRMHIHQMDVKTAFLNGDIDRELYVKPPEPFHTPGKVWKLNKALYGLRQAPSRWAEKFSQIVKEIGFEPTKSDPCVYTYTRSSQTCYLLCYVDDLLIATADESFLKAIKESLMARLKIRDLGPISTFLNINFKTEGSQIITLSQCQYIEALAKQYGQSTSSPIFRLPIVDTQKAVPGEVREDVPYRELVGALNYIATWTRPDIAAVVSYLSRSFQAPKSSHWKAAIQVLRYLFSTKEKKLRLGLLDNSNLMAFSDANFASPADKDRRSQSGGVIRLCGSTIVWYSRRQKTISKSTTASEYCALSILVDEVIWMQQFLNELHFSVLMPTPVFEDCRPALAIATNQKTAADSKHIEVKYHSTKDLQARGYIDITFVNTANQLADDLTKVKMNPRDTDVLLGSTMWTLNQGVCCE